MFKKDASTDLLSFLLCLYKYFHNLQKQNKQHRYGQNDGLQYILVFIFLLYKIIRMNIEKNNTNIIMNNEKKKKKKKKKKKNIYI
ncbi:hypothetical protein PFFCH_04088 [Plasmodium falciparum FCH/4]|uniref:Uncharacterized protein n=1 Tax=Plasmodium falciparum FCH/4 TaxID=1036724 RepID=A0A024VKR0_PLAFA|nr:hypothetical protein PFFCH_04088 [Plasmodium falciparum FCH/4]